MGKTRQIVGPVLIWLLVAAVIGALVEVPPWSANLFEAMTVQPWVDLGHVLSPIALIALVVLYLGMLLRTWLTKEHLPFIRLIFGAVATTLVYGLNRVLKENYGQIRPCHVFETGGSCPAVENFTYPSNHTVIAFGLAMGLAFAIPWLSYLAFPLAILAGISRVLAGHHFPHDVIAAAVLGALTVVGLLYMFIKVQTRLAEKLSAARPPAPVEH